MHLQQGVGSESGRAIGSSGSVVGDRRVASVGDANINLPYVDNPNPTLTLTLTLLQTLIGYLDAPYVDNLLFNPRRTVRTTTALCPSAVKLGHQCFYNNWNRGAPIQFDFLF